MNQDGSPERNRLRPDEYTLAAAAVFLILGVTGWRSHVISHEMIYLLGSRRVADPTLLAVDFTWSRLPPTTFLFDHLVAPLWRWFGEFTIVNLGRAVVWIGSAASLAALGRAMRLPPAALVAGLATWLLWGQTLADCGAPFEGFQVKAFAYPLVFAAVALAIRGRLAFAGAAAGLATAFHIIVGGWGCLALFCALAARHRRVTLRGLVVFLLAAAPFVVPVVAAMGRFHQGGASAEERQRMNAIYVTVAEPGCCQLDEFMTPHRWARASVLFVLAPLLIWFWPAREPARLLAGFVLALVAVFLLAEVAQRLHWYAYLTVLPCQLGASLPAFFLFVFCFAWIARGIREFPPGRAVAAFVLLAVIWLVYDREVIPNLIAAPGKFIAELRRPRWGGPPGEPEYGPPELYAWIRANTPRDSVFVTPLLKDFWPYAERAQVASRRHPPPDRRLIEWSERLQAMNELDLKGDLLRDGGQLTAAELDTIRKRFGATHYLSARARPEFAASLLVSMDGYFVYRLDEPASR